MSEIRESCQCGASFSISDSVAPKRWVSAWMTLIQEWRKQHACNRDVRSEPTDWREEHVGKMCAICTTRLYNKTQLTTVGSRAIHIRCRTCYICTQEKPHSMTWGTLKNELGDILRLVHPKCLKERNLSDGEDNQGQEVRIIEGTVVQVGYDPSVGRDRSIRFTRTFSDSGEESIDWDDSINGGEPEQRED